MVGEAGFEPTISCSQSTRVARLRYSPPDHLGPRSLYPGTAPTTRGGAPHALPDAPLSKPTDPVRSTAEWFCQSPLEGTRVADGPSPSASARAPTTSPSASGTTSRPRCTCISRLRKYPPKPQRDDRRSARRCGTGLASRRDVPRSPQRGPLSCDLSSAASRLRSRTFDPASCGQPVRADLGVARRTGP